MTSFCTFASKTPLSRSNFRGDAMDIEKALQQLAREYEQEGYGVVLRPQGDQLPAFARDFGVDLLATRAGERVLVQVKQDRAALEADPHVPVRAGITNTQPGWRYDLVVLEKDDPVRRLLKGTREPTRDQIEQMLAEAERVTQEGALRAGFLVAWAGLEAAMRRAASRAGVGGAIGTSPNLLVREVYTSGYIARDDFARIDDMRRLRTEMVHGLAPAVLGADTVAYILRQARQLLAQSETVQAAG